MTKTTWENKIIIKTLSVIPFVIAYLTSIPIEAYLLSFIEFNNKYLIALCLHLISFISFIILLLVFSGTLTIEFKKEQKKIRIEWNKKPLFTKTENQVISLTEIENWKLLSGRGADRLKIFLKNNKVLKIDFNNLLDFGRNTKKKDTLINYLISEKINSI